MTSEGRAVHVRILRGVCVWATLWFRGSQGPSWPCHFACPPLPAMGVLPGTGCLQPASCHRSGILNRPGSDGDSVVWVSHATSG